MTRRFTKAQETAFLSIVEQSEGKERFEIVCYEPIRTLEALSKKRVILLKEDRLVQLTSYGVQVFKDDYPTYVIGKQEKVQAALTFLRDQQYDDVRLSQKRYDVRPSYNEDYLIVPIKDHTIEPHVFSDIQEAFGGQCWLKVEAEAELERSNPWDAESGEYAEVKALNILAGPK